jgi:hypothetical protein
VCFLDKKPEFIYCAFFSLKQTIEEVFFVSRNKKIPQMNPKTQQQFGQYLLQNKRLIQK